MRHWVEELLAKTLKVRKGDFFLWFYFDSRSFFCVFEGFDKYNIRKFVGVTRQSESAAFSGVGIISTTLVL